MHTNRRTTTVHHGITSTGAQRAIDIAARIAEEKAERRAAGAQNVEVCFGQQPGTLLVVEWADAEVDDVDLDADAMFPVPPATTRSSRDAQIAHRTNKRGW